MQLRRALQLTVTFLPIATFLLAFAVPQASAQISCELHQKGFWRNNPADWPVTSLQLGSNTYTQQQLLTILATRVGGDASVMVAQQLIAALLNIENGTDPSPVDATITDANSLLGGGTIPEGIRPNTTVGKQMVSDAKVLENYNQGLLTQPCGCTPGTPGCSWATGDMHTFTQDVYGSGASAGGLLVSNNFSTLYGGSGLLIGGTNTLRFTDAGAVFTYLPASGPPGSLTGSLIDPITSSSGELGGQVLALQLNVDLSDAGALQTAVPLGSLYFCNFSAVPQLNGTTIDEFLATANWILGGGGATIDASTATQVAGAVNAAFVSGAPSSFAQNNLRVGSCGWEQGDMSTASQGGWDSGSAATLLAANFSSVYGGARVIGGGFTTTFTNASAVFAYLPASGSPATFSGNLTNPLTTSAGELGGQVLALQLNNDFSTMFGNAVDLGSVRICNFSAIPVVNGMTIDEFLTASNWILGGGGGSFGPSTALTVANLLNNAFVDGTPSAFAQANLVAAPSCAN